MSPGSTAARRGGVLPGDVIVGVNGTEAVRLDAGTLLPPSGSPTASEEVLGGEEKAGGYLSVSANLPSYERAARAPRGEAHPPYLLASPPPPAAPLDPRARRYEALMGRIKAHERSEGKPLLLTFLRTPW
jgi:hypothetical protein